jgi:phage shock protein A
MAWWNDILHMLKDELSAAARPATHVEPPSVQRAQNLLRRTARELATARSRADGLRKRLTRTQADLDALTRAQEDPHYRERLAALAHALETESAAAGGFAAHIAQLDALHDRVERELRQFERDVGMARSAHAAREATTAAARKRARAKPAAAGEPGFKRARPEAVMRRLKDLPAPRAAATKTRKRRDED